MNCFRANWLSAPFAGRTARLCGGIERPPTRSGSRRTAEGGLRLICDAMLAVAYAGLAVCAISTVCRSARYDGGAARSISAFRGWRACRGPRDSRTRRTSPNHTSHADIVVPMAVPAFDTHFAVTWKVTSMPPRNAPPQLRLILRFAAYPARAARQAKKNRRRSRRGDPFLFFRKELFTAPVRVHFTSARSVAASRRSARLPR